MRLRLGAALAWAMMPSASLAQPTPPQLIPPPLQQNPPNPPPRRPPPGGSVAVMMANGTDMGGFDMIDDPILLGFGNDDFWIAEAPLNAEASLLPPLSRPASATSRSHRPRRRPR